MAILIEAVTVVIVNSSLERRFAGGVAGFAEQAPNSSYRTDGTLAAVSFMVVDDAKMFVGMLAKHGFCDPWSTRCDDIAVVDQRAGFLAPCDWLRVDLRGFTDQEGKPFGATIAWIGSDEPGAVVAHRGWPPRPGLEAISQEDLEQHYVLVKTDVDPVRGGAVMTYRHRETGQMKYIARTVPPGFSELQERYATLAKELANVMTLPAPKCNEAAATLHGRATKLVEDTEPMWRPGPLLLQGIAARLAGRWRDAEPAFRELTELAPDKLEGWLELTWTLAKLDRLHEAEIAARRAVEVDINSASAHGNLATTLSQQGKLEEALLAAERAHRLNPSDATFRQQLDLVRAAVNRQPAECETPVPWYKRWFR